MLWIPFILFVTYRLYKLAKWLFNRQNDRAIRAFWLEQLEKEQVRAAVNPYSRDLNILGLSDLPLSVEELSKARREALKRVHPDRVRYTGAVADPVAAMTAIEVSFKRVLNSFAH